MQKRSGLRRKQRAGGFFILAIAVMTLAALEAPGTEWAGKGRYRFLVRVEPVKIVPRVRDEMPAEVELDLAAMLRRSKIRGKVDLTSLQVIRYDARTGKAHPYGDYAYALGPHDRPFRWYDAEIPYRFPEFDKAINTTDGEILRTEFARAGYFYNAVGSWDSGRLAWTHTQEGTEPSFYAIYFDLKDDGKMPEQLPPRGWLGDGMQRTEPHGSTTTGSGHTRIAVTDWNNDGLADILYGEDYGHLFWMPNTGNPKKPQFAFSKMIFDAQGLPIDIGIGMVPVVVDWDGDGLKDLLAGTHWNRIVFLKNQGTANHPRLVYQGFIKAEGKILTLPIRPIIGRPEDPFKAEHYAVLEAVDWDGDGNTDLLAGGYLTGRIYFYRNSGRDSAGLPLLKDHGPLEADGKALNVGEWVAAPTAADFDGDGDFDLISGNLGMLRGEASKGYSFLRYFENVGTRIAPVLRQRDFPKVGLFPSGGLGTPRAVDLNGDGVLDLALSARSNIYVYENIGTRTAPQFAVHDSPLLPAWGRADLPGTGAERSTQFIDWNGDGFLDIVSRLTAWINRGNGNPGLYEDPIPLLAKDQQISHSSEIGDDWFWPRFYDLDRDGRLDLLFGEHAGRIWLHKNVGSGKENRFDTKGYTLKTKDGMEIRVGPVGADPSKTFTALQGARTVFSVADFNADGLEDLVVGDTFGIVRYYENAGTRANPVFAMPVVVGDLKSRILVDAADWDGDGKTDILAGSSGSVVRIFLNVGQDGEARFAEGFDPQLPRILQSRIIAVDMNRDGDLDLFVPSTQGSCFVERSFLQNGYARAKLLSEIEKAPTR